MTIHAPSERALPGFERPRLEAHRRIAADLVFAAVCSGAFLAVLLIYGPVNVEQYHHSHPSVRIFHRSLLQGHVLFWTSSLGFGTPLPLGENLAFHPLMLLEPLISLRWVLRSFWWLHLTLGGFFMLRVARMFAVAPAIAKVAAFSFLLSPVTINYSYTDDWPSVFVGWTLLPLVIELTLRTADREHGRWIRPAALLALVLAFLLWNSHLGHLFAWGLPLGAVVVVATAAHPRTLARFGLVVLAAMAATSGRLFALWHELQLYPPDLEKWTQAPLGWGDWLRQLFRPVDMTLLSALRNDHLGVALRTWWDSMSFVRIPFLGFAFSLAALWALVVVSRRGAVSERGRWPLALAVGFGVSVALSMVPAQSILRAASGMWQFRDAAILLGLLLAGIGLTGLRSAGRHDLVRKALLIQVVQVLLVAVPPIETALRHRDRGTDFYRGERDAELAAWIEDATGGASSRVLVSPGIGRILMQERTHLAELGLLAIGDLEPLGLRPVNGYFKNVSMDAVYPSFKVLGGMIGTDAELVTATTNLDVLAVDYLLSLSDETSLDVSGFVSAAPELPLTSGGGLRLLRNPDAWPLANVFDPAVLDARLEPRAVCDLPGLFCRDLSPLGRYRLDVRIALDRGEDRFELDLEPGPEPRVVVTSFLYRPEWRAVSGRGEPLRTVEVADALLSVEVPAGVTKISLEHRPLLRRALLGAGALVVLGLISIAAGGWLRRIE